MGLSLRRAVEGAHAVGQGLHQDGEAAQKAEQLVERAWALLNTSTLPRDAAYRFICEKCAPVIAHYGRLDWAEALRKRAGKKEAGDEEGC